MIAQVKGAPFVGYGTTDNLIRRELEQSALTLEEMAKVLRGVDRPGCADIAETQAKRARDALR